MSSEPGQPPAGHPRWPGLRLRPSRPAAVPVADLLDVLRDALADRYEVDRAIGRGATAVVFLAQDLKYRRRVALKVLPPELSVTLAAERFLREIEIAAQLVHPHVLALYE